MHKQSILIVDDDNLTSSGLVSLLSSDTVATRVASTMDEAEMLLNTETFDLAIVDLRLTGSVGREGLELISIIKQQRPETQVVLFTAYGSQEIEREARERGAADYWEKTIKVPAMIERIRALGIWAGPEGRQHR